MQCECVQVDEKCLGAAVVSARLSIECGSTGELQQIEDLEISQTLHPHSVYISNSQLTFNISDLPVDHKCDTELTLSNVAGAVRLPTMHISELEQMYIIG